MLFHKHKGETTSSKGISLAFILIGVAMPVSIFAESVVLGHTLPLWASAPLAAVYVVSLAMRVHCVSELGKFYSVDVCTFEGHRIVETGAYRYFRHPLYLLGIIEYAAYPLACGAYMTAIAMVVVGVPITLARRAHEEKILIAKFGKEYEDYRKRTLF